MATTTNHPSIKQQDVDILKQYKWKSFKDSLLSTIQLFDKSREWADLIKCLKQLINVLDRYQHYPLIPERLIVSKRLSQCLNPNLPSGVHLKVLETYDQIFKQIGDQRLALDLSVWSSGLFAFLPFASLQAKPLVLDLLERYYLVLPVPALLPCMSALILAVLSALEEESGEISNRAKLFLDQMMTKTMESKADSNVFFQCLWRCVLLTPHYRVAAISYITHVIKKRKSENENQFPSEVFAENMELVVSSIVASLHDHSILAQRAALELLSTQITFDINVMNRKCYQVLLRNSLLLLCKKDLSINRRVFQWLFGNAASHFDSEYFSKYSLPILIDSIRALMRLDGGQYEHASQPLTVVLLLLQADLPIIIQSQISCSIIESMLYYVHSHLQGHDSQNVIESFLQLFPMMEPKSIVWDCLISILKEANNCSNLETAENDVQYLRLVDLIGGVFSILYSERLDQVLLIGLEVEILKFLHDRIKSRYPNVEVIETCLLLCINIFTKIPCSKENKAVVDQIYSKVERIFVLFVNSIIFEQQREGPLGDDYVQFNDVFKSACTFMTILLLTSSQNSLELVNPPTIENLPKFVNSLFKCCMDHDDLHVVVFSIETFLGLISNHECGLDPRIQQYMTRNSNGFNHLEQIIRKLWSLLVPEAALIHFEAVKLLVEIHGLNRILCNSILSDYMLDNNIDITVEAHRRFALIWRLIDELGIEARVFDDGMFLMLDSIKSDDSNLRLAGRSWLIASFRKMQRILDPLFQTLIDEEYVRMGGLSSDGSEPLPVKRKSVVKINPRSPYDQERCKYVLGIWNAMLQVAPRNFIQRAMELQLTDDVQNNFKRHIGKNFYPLATHQAEQAPSSLFNFDSKDYFSLIVTTCVQFMECGVSFEPNKPSKQHNFALSDKTVLEESIRTKSIVFLRDILVNGKMFKRITDFAQALVEAVLLHLRNAVETNDAVFQVEILGVLHTLLSHLHAHSSITGLAGPKATAGGDSFLMDSSTTPVVVLVHSPNFLPTLLQGILVANESQINPAFYSYSLLNYWIDYVSSFLPFLETALPFVVTSIVPHFCNIIRDNAQAGIDSLRSQSIQKLLEGLKKMLLFCVLEYNGTESQNSKESEPDEGYSSVFNAATSTVAMPFKLISDLVKDVFTHEEIIIKHANISPASEAQQFMLSELPVVIETMAVVWKALRAPYTTEKSVTNAQRRGTSNLGLVQYGSLHTKYAIEEGIVRFIDPLIEKYRSQLAASLVILWGNLHPEIERTIDCKPHDLDSHIIDILNTVDSATPETIMSSIVEVITNIRQNKILKVSSPADDTHDGAQIEHQPKMREHVALGFLQVYLGKCILTDKASFILAKLLQLIREYISPTNSTSNLINNLDLMVISMLTKTLHSFLLRWNMQSEDKKLRLKLKEVFHQLFGTGLLVSVREMNNRKNQFLRNSKNSKLSIADKENLLRSDLHDVNDPSLQFLRMMTDNLVSFMEKIPHDYTATSNLVTIVLNPIMNILKNNSIINIPRIHHTVRLLSKFNSPMLNMKPLRKELWDIFYTSTFFKVQKETIELWKIVLHTLLNGGETIDQSAVQNEEEVLLFEQQQLIQKENKILFSDLLNRFSNTQSIFTSRDSEALQRANLLKRLAFILYVAGMDDYHSFLQSVLEKMVESLKLNPSSSSNNVLVTNILFCLRILIIRMSPLNLAPIWPMVITELLKIFTNLDHIDETRGDTLVVMEAIKFIDFALIALPEEFHLYKWMFCTQTCDSNAQVVFEPYLSQVIDKYPTNEAPAPMFPHNLDNMSGAKRKPIDTDNYSPDWPSIAKLSAALMSQKREQELYYTGVNPHFDEQYINHLLASDFSEISGEDHARLLSANFVPNVEKKEPWVVVSVKSPQEESLQSQPSGNDAANSLHQLPTAPAVLEENGESSNNTDLI